MTRSAIDSSVAPSGAGCVECDANNGWWLHLRRCTQCGHIGCCDSSPSQHATKHAMTSGHAVIATFEPGENWFYDYTTKEVYEDDVDLAPPTHHPVDQPVPGPQSRVPSDWESHLH